MVEIVDAHGLYLLCIAAGGRVLVDKNVDLSDIIEALREAERQVASAAEG